MTERERDEQYEAYLEEVNACNDCLYYRGYCSHPERHSWQRRTLGGQSIITTCDYFNLEDAAERVAAAAWR